ncbi:MAG TPA: tetratricopeptide repeat protein [Burkholderiales bacterium]
MSNPPYIFDVSAETFPERVLAASSRHPVLVAFWSRRVNPSLLLVPRLIRLATQCNGRFALALYDIEASVAPDAGVTAEAVPLVRLYRHGHVVDALQGDASEGTLRAFMARHMRLRGAMRLYAEAIRAYGAGDAERGVQLAAEAALTEPEDVHTPAEVVKLLVLAGRFDEAEALLRALPPAVRESAELRNLAAHLAFIRVSLTAPPMHSLESAVTVDPWNLEARYQLAATKVVQNDYEGAMQQLLEIERRNPGYRNQAGRNGLLALFNMLGEDDDRVRRYRPLLMESLN